MGIGKFQPPTKSVPLNQSKKNRHSWLPPRGDPLYQIWYKSTHWRLLGKWVKYNKKYFLFIYSFLLRHAHKSDNVGGVSQGSIQTKFGSPYVFLQPLKLATSNLVHDLGLGLAYQKTTFRAKIGGGLGQGSNRKNGTPYLFLQPLKQQLQIWYTTWVLCHI